MEIRISPECAAELHQFCDVVWREEDSEIRNMCNCGNGSCHRNGSRIRLIRVIKGQPE